MFSLKSPLPTFIAATKGVLLSPVSFFRSVYWGNASIADALIFTFIWNLLSALISRLILSFTLPFGMMRGTNGFGVIPFVGIPSFPVFLVAPIMAVLFLVIGAVVSTQYHSS